MYDIEAGDDSLEGLSSSKLKHFYLYDLPDLGAGPRIVLRSIRMRGIAKGSIAGHIFWSGNERFVFMAEKGFRYTKEELLEIIAIRGWLKKQYATILPL